jgi:aryl carrier-like protein
MIEVTAATEATLCRIIADVLGVDHVGPDDGFFEAGGDSVLAVQVVARVREAGLDLTVRRLFDHQTPAALAAEIGELPADDGTEPPLVSFTDGEFGEFEDADAGDSGDSGDPGTETEWETSP